MHTDPPTGAAAAPVAPATPPSAATLVDALFFQAPHSVALYDARGRVAAGNAAYERHFGIRLADVPPGYSLFTDPQLEASGLVALLRRAYAGEVVTLPPVRYDAAQATGGAGRVVWTQGHCHPVRDADGSVTHVAVVHTDVTEQMEAEAALRTANAALEAQTTMLQRQGLELERSHRELLERAAALERTTESLARARDAADEARAAAESLRQRAAASEALARQLFALSPLPKWVYDAETLAFLDVNDAAVRRYGYTREEFLAMTIRDIRPPEEIPQMLAVARAPHPTGAFGGVFHHRTRTGELLDVEIYLRDVPYEGRRAVIVVVQDVTERRRTEAALRESEARFRETADAAPVLIWTAGTDAGCDWFNQPWLTFTGRPMAAELGNGWAERVHPDDLDRCLAIYLGAFHARQPFSMEYRLQRHDGVYRWLLDNAVPRFAADGTFVGYVGTCADITDQRDALAAAKAAAAQLQEQALELELANQQLQATAVALEERTEEAERQRAAAEAANAAKGQFLSTISHELRTPLNAIGGYTELLLLGLRGPLDDAQRQDMERIRRANQHLMALVTDILNFVRIDAGQIEYRMGDVELGAIVTDLESLLRPQLAAQGIAFDHDACAADTPDQPHRVWADPEKLRQILLNLLTNAVKFTDVGGRVTLACTVDDAGDVVRLRVTDTGRGIPPDQLDRIFEPFVQVDRHLTHASQQGVGLGLAISRDLARGMGGDLTVESAPGVGSTFTLVLPTAGRGGA